MTVPKNEVSQFKINYIFKEKFISYYNSPYHKFKRFIIYAFKLNCI